MSQYPAPEMMDRYCIAPGCGKHFQARKADVKRGWGLFCGKACKAINQAMPGGRQRIREAQHGKKKVKAVQVQPNKEPHPYSSFDEWDKIAAEEDAQLEKQNGTQAQGKT